MSSKKFPDYGKTRRDALEYYSTIGRVYCPALGEHVSFPSESFNHLIFKAPRAERDRRSQIMRFKLLPRAVRLIKKATTYQEYEEALRTFGLKRNGRRFTESRRVQYWGIIAIIETRKIKVVLRRVGHGHLHFWSVIPDWVTSRARDGKMTIRMMKGDPAED